MRNLIVKELCINEKDEKGIREIIYETEKETLQEALNDFEENFDIDKIIFTDDLFEGECQGSVTVSVEWEGKEYQSLI